MKAFGESISRDINIKFFSQTKLDIRSVTKPSGLIILFDQSMNFTFDFEGEGGEMKGMRGIPTAHMRGEGRRDGVFGFPFIIKGTQSIHMTSSDVCN
jgi:hypothetical protein